MKAKKYIIFISPENIRGFLMIWGEMEMKYLNIFRVIAKSRENKIEHKL